MRTRLPVLALLVGALVLGATAVADAWVVTDAEQLDAVLDGLTRGAEGRRVDAFLRHVDPLREPVELRTDEGVLEFGEGQEVELAGDVRHALGALDDDDVDVVQRGVEMRGDDATVALRARTKHGLLDVRASLHRHDDRWLVRRVHVR